jgi:hypothetical protein
MMPLLGIFKKHLILVLFFAAAILLPLTIFVSSRSDVLKPEAPKEEIKPTIQPFPSEGEYVKNELIIQYKDGMEYKNLSEERKKEIDAYLKDLGVTSQEKLTITDDPNLDDFYILIFEQGKDVKSISEKLLLPELEGVEPNPIYETQRFRR